MSTGLSRIVSDVSFTEGGVPERILMDQGKGFTSEVVEQLCSQSGVSQSTTSAYHPQGNGQVE